MAAKILFSEKQRFTQWWLWLLVIGSALFPLFLIFRELQKDPAFADPEKITGLIIALLVMVPVIGLFFLMRLETQITEAGINVRFFPFHFNFRHYPWSDLEQADVQEYSPLLDYGGWGLRYGLKGRAFNVSGNQGIKLKFKDDSKLLIGTNKPEEAAAALKAVAPRKAGVA